jgi:phosphoglycolate phosphatase
LPFPGEAGLSAGSRIHILQSCLEKRLRSGYISAFSEPTFAGRTEDIRMTQHDTGKPKIDLIVTDLGGTLMKTDDAIIAAVRQAAQEMGVPEGCSDPVYDVFGTSIWEYIHAYLPEGHKDRTDACHERFWQLFPSQVLHWIQPFAGVENALTELKARGVRLAVLSGLRIESIRAILATLSFQGWDEVRSSMLYNAQAGDSRAAGITALVKDFGVSPSRTIYIGDTDHDVRQAKKAGVLSAVVQTGGQAVHHLAKIQAQNPHHLLASFADLPEVV